MTAPLFLLLDGRSGAGKTTLAHDASEHLRHAGLSVSRVDMEDLYPGWEGLEPAIRTLAGQIAPALASGRTAQWRPWDWEQSRPGPERLTEPAEIVLVEGVGSSSRAVVEAVESAGAQAVCLWLDMPADARRTRALARDGETYRPFWDMWAAQEDAWLAGPLAPARADVTVQQPAGSAAPSALLAAAALWPATALGVLLRDPWRRVSRGRIPDHGLPSASGAQAPSDLSRTRTSDTTPLPDDDCSASLARLFADIAAGANHTAWLDSSMREASDRNRTILFAAGDLGAEHARGTLLAGSGPAGDSASGGRASGETASGETGSAVTGSDATAIRGSRETPFFEWLSEAWPLGTAAADACSRVPCSTSAQSAPQIGWIAQLGYELRRECGTPDAPHADATDADARLFWPTRLMSVDVATGEWTRWERGPLLPAAPAAATEDVSEAQRVVVGPDLTWRESREEYLAKITAAQAEIRVGNSYEVCLTTRLSAPAPADPMALFLALREVSPAPFGSFMRFAAGSDREWSLVSSSPERFLKVADGIVTAEPIKGTRPRGGSPEQDATLRAELEGSAKDRAENIMIVDLLRNDLGATARTGSVRVERLCAIEEYATVFQMVSTISAHVREGVPSGELLRAAFPPGSMTGCPKISTMEILGRLEGERRGAYSGSVGYLAWDGSADLNVVIRSMEIRGGILSVGVGGAITIDSDPAAEWDEVQAKTLGVMRALRRVLGR